jgi:chromate transporter
MQAGNLKEVARLFLQFGLFGFGGPAAHIAMMHRAIVVQRKWMTEQHFLDLVGATNLIPGPNSTEMAIHIGRERAGTNGLIVAGICFILPAVILTGFLAYLYKEYGQLPAVQPFIYGIKPAIIAIILAAVYPLAQKSFKSVGLALLGLAVLILSLLHLNELALMFGAGFCWMGLQVARKAVQKPGLPGFFPFPLLQSMQIALSAASNTSVFWIFLKIGALLYGSGYVLFAFLDAELVAKGLLSRTQLIDAIAVGQFTPGPVFSAVTFIGYQMNGWSGAAMATLGVFLPSFVFVALLNPLVRRMRNSKNLAVFLDAVNVASVAIIGAVCIEMGKSTLTDARAIAICLISMVLTFGFRQLNSAWVVVGALLGYLLNF